MEVNNGFEAVRNNVLGTLVLARAAAEAGVPKFVLVSTDKAVNPVNIMGASKRLAEMICQSLQQTAADAAIVSSTAAASTTANASVADPSVLQSPTRFVIVRFGNVLGSTGSVVNRFREQIANGGPVTVTHPEMKRYFMTIPEACQLILQAAAIGSQDAVYTLDMGEPVSIRLLAEQMIRLAGKEPQRDVAIVYTGLRPGEKLHETLFHADERYRPTAHPKILQAEARAVVAEKISMATSRLRDAVARYDLEELATILCESVPEFAPDDAARATPSATVVAFPARNARKI